MQPSEDADCPVCGALRHQSSGGPSEPARLTEEGRPPKPARHHALLTAYYATAIVWGIRCVYFDEPSRLDWLVPLLWSVILGWWAILDARHRGHPIPLLARPWFVLFAPFAVPGYVIWSRRLRGAGYVVLHGVAWYALSTAAMHIAGTLTYGDQWWQALRW